MKRVCYVALFVLGFAVAGTFSATVIAGTTTSQTTTAPIATSPPPTTTTAPTTTAPPVTAPAPPTAPPVTVPPPPPTTTTAPPPAPKRKPKPKPKPAPKPDIPRGVRVAGVRVGGMERKQAAAAVDAAFARPLKVTVDGHVYLVHPTDYAKAYTETAVARARHAKPPQNVRLVVSIHGGQVRAWAAKVAAHYQRKPVDATLAFRDGRPVVHGNRTGRRLDARELAARVIHALQRNTRRPVHLRTRAVQPQVSASSFGPLIVIDREHNRLTLYRGGKAVRTFPVATGQAIYPTPAGTFQIVVKERNPWWYPPTYDSWAKGLSPVPPGPDNPLGTRWMGLSAPGVGIHGTDEPSSIGYSASHGCIRMQVPDAEWLFERVDVGTTVHII